jgi:hypothetical protein
MKYKLRKIFLVACTLLGTLTLFAQSGKSGTVQNANSTAGYLVQLRDGFANPGNMYRALPLLGFKKKDESVTEYADRLVKGKWGGVNAAYPDGGSEYLRDVTGWNSYMDLIRKCKEQGLKTWIYDENGYPSGRAGGQVLAGHPEFEAQGLFYASKDIQVRGSGNSDALHETEWRIPDGTPFFVAVYALDREGHITGKAAELTGSVKDGLLKVSLKPGSWRLMAFVQNRLFDGTHASLTGGPYINILDADAVKRFIRITHESYYARCGEDFGKTITAIFNDEVSVMNGFLTDDSQPFPAIAWYHGFPELFLKRTGYDIRDCLPALFDDAGEATTRMRCDFYSMLGQQIADSFFKQIREWCAEHKIASTGHLLWEESLIYHAHFYGTVFPSYKELDWPGIDELLCQYGCTSGSHTEGGPVTPKLASSAAHIWEKERTMSESFWSVTNKTPIEEVIAQYSWQAVLGINTLTTLTIQNSYSPEELGRLNDCVGRLNYMLTQGQFKADVAILYPIASVWAGFNPTTRHVHNLGDNPEAREVDEAWRYVSAQVLSCQRDFDYLDEELIRSATVANGKLNIGKNSYSVLVLPHVTTLGFATLKKIKQFVDNGGALISWQTLPFNRADAGPGAEQRALVEELWNNHTGQVIHTMTESTLRQALMNSGTTDLVVTPATTEIYYQHRALPQGDIYFLVNNSKAPVSGDFAFRSGGKAERWNPVNGETTAVTATKTSAGSSIKLTLAQRSSVFVIFNRN